MGQKLSNIHWLVDKTMTVLKATWKSPEQVLVGALGQPDVSAITEEALPGF